MFGFIRQFSNIAPKKRFNGYKMQGFFFLIKQWKS